MIMSKGMLRITNLHKTFKGNIKAVQGISVEVEKGDVFGFLGPNGAGKSTTIRMVLGLIKPDEGEVFIDGVDLSSNKLKALERVGALVEGPAFYNYLSAYENLEIFATYSGGVPKGRIEEVLNMVGLSGQSTKKVTNYSMGMKQRLGIAQALLNKPKLIILDEPTNGLDPYGVQEMRDLVKSLSKENITVFISSHILSEIEQICNKVLIINKGKTVAKGLVNELLNPQKNIYELSSPYPDKLIKIITRKRELAVVSTEPIRLAISSGKPEEILESLIKEGAVIRSYFPYKPSLEDFFFKMTGGGKDDLYEN